MKSLLAETVEGRQDFNFLQQYLLNYENELKVGVSDSLENYTEATRTFYVTLDTIPPLPELEIALRIISGNDQSGLVGRCAEYPLIVQAYNALSETQLLEGIPLLYEISQGGGLFTEEEDYSTVTNEEGNAALHYHYGTNSEIINQVTVGVLGDEEVTPVEFDSLDGYLPEITIEPLNVPMVGDAYKIEHPQWCALGDTIRVIVTDPSSGLGINDVEVRFETEGYFPDTVPCLPTSLITTGTGRGTTAFTILPYDVVEITTTIKAYLPEFIGLDGEPVSQTIKAWAQYESPRGLRVGAWQAQIGVAGQDLVQQPLRADIYYPPGMPEPSIVTFTVIRGGGLVNGMPTIDQPITWLGPFSGEADVIFSMGSTTEPQIIEARCIFGAKEEKVHFAVGVPEVYLVDNSFTKLDDIIGIDESRFDPLANFDDYKFYVEIKMPLGLPDEFEVSLETLDHNGNPLVNDTYPPYEVQNVTMVKVLPTPSNWYAFYRSNPDKPLLAIHNQFLQDAPIETWPYTFQRIIPGNKLRITVPPEYGGFTALVDTKVEINSVVTANTTSADLNELVCGSIRTASSLKVINVEVEGTKQKVIRAVTEGMESLWNDQERVGIYDFLILTKRFSNVGEPITIRLYSEPAGTSTDSRIKHSSEQASLSHVITINTIGISFIDPATGEKEDTFLIAPFKEDRFWDSTEDISRLPGWYFTVRFDYGSSGQAIVTSYDADGEALDSELVTPGQLVKIIREDSPAGDGYLQATEYGVMEAQPFETMRSSDENKTKAGLKDTEKTITVTTDQGEQLHMGGFHGLRIYKFNPQGEIVGGMYLGDFPYPVAGGPDECRLVQILDPDLIITTTNNATGEPCRILDISINGGNVQIVGIWNEQTGTFDPTGFPEAAVWIDRYKHQTHQAFLKDLLDKFLPPEWAEKWHEQIQIAFVVEMQLCGALSPEDMTSIQSQFLNGESLIDAIGRHMEANAFEIATKALVGRLGGRVLAPVRKTFSKYLGRFSGGWATGAVEKIIWDRINSELDDFSVKYAKEIFAKIKQTNAGDARDSLDDRMGQFKYYIEDGVDPADLVQLKNALESNDMKKATELYMERALKLLNTPISTTDIEIYAPIGAGNPTYKVVFNNKTGEVVAGSIYEDIIDRYSRSCALEAHDKNKDRTEFLKMNLKEFNRRFEGFLVPQERFPHSPLPQSED